MEEWEGRAREKEEEIQLLHLRREDDHWGKARGRVEEMELLHRRREEDNWGRARGRAEEIELLHLRRELVFSDASSQLAENALLRRHIERLSTYLTGAHDERRNLEHENANLRHKLKMLNAHTAKRSSSNRGCDGTCIMDFSSSEAKKSLSSVRVRGSENIQGPRDKKFLMDVLKCEAEGWKEGQEWGKPVETFANNICFDGTQTILDGDLRVVYSCHTSTPSRRSVTHGLAHGLGPTLPMSSHSMPQINSKHESLPFQAGMEREEVEECLSVCTQYEVGVHAIGGLLAKSQYNLLKFSEFLSNPPQ